MNILHLHPGPDTGGQSMAGKRALEAAGDEVRVFTRGHHKFGYDRAEAWDDDEVRESYTWADVVIVHNDPLLIRSVAHGRWKPVIVHHHGSRFRGDPAPLWEAGESIAARQIVSTVDLLLSVPDGKRAEWMPQIVDTERMALMREAHYRPPHQGRLRITHAPTARIIKGTRFVIRAQRALKHEADVIIIQRQPWHICLAFKANSDIFIDQLNLGYGNNAIEAWAMGLPVLAAAPEPILARMRDEYGGELPFYRTSADALVGDLRALIASETLREEWAERGRRHVERFHAPAAWVERTRRIYAGDPVEMAA